MASDTLPVSPLPAIPRLVQETLAARIHEIVRREIARMNTAICQATSSSPIKVSLTWRPNSRFAQELSEQLTRRLASDGIEVETIGD